MVWVGSHYRWALCASKESLNGCMCSFILLLLRAVGARSRRPGGGVTELLTHEQGVVGAAVSGA